jgi:hypothetical protein
MLRSDPDGAYNAHQYTTNATNANFAATTGAGPLSK